jgi:LPXTG-motif cell wall-anchored protein
MKGHIYPKTENFVGAEGVISGLIKGVGEASGVIITSLGSVKDLKLRREYEIRIAELNRIEQANLSKKLVAAQTDNEKRKVFADMLVSTSIARINALNKKDNNIIFYVLGGVIILGAAFLIYKKYKK